MGDSVGVSFGCLADCLDALVNKGFYLNLSLSMLFSPPRARSGVKGRRNKDTRACEVKTGLSKHLKAI